MDSKLTKAIKIASYDTDRKMLLKPSAFMNYAQEIAGDSSEMLGFGYDELAPNHEAWLVSRMKMVFLRHPLWRETVQLSTWHRGPQGPFFIRDYQMTDSEGNALVNSTSSWIIVNLDDRSIRRGTGLPLDDEKSICNDFAIEQPCSKLRIPSGLVPVEVGTHKVCYSDVDKNSHANNVMYVSWSMDTMDSDFLDAHPVKELEIDFFHEILPGETVTLYRYDAPEAAVYIEGRCGEKQSFISKYVF